MAGYFTPRKNLSLFSVFRVLRLASRADSWSDAVPSFLTIGTFVPFAVLERSAAVGLRSLCSCVFFFTCFEFEPNAKESKGEMKKFRTALGVGGIRMVGFLKSGQSLWRFSDYWILCNIIQYSIEPDE